MILVTSLNFLLTQNAQLLKLQRQEALALLMSVSKLLLTLLLTGEVHIKHKLKVHLSSNQAEFLDLYGVFQEKRTPHREHSLRLNIIAVSASKETTLAANFLMMQQN